MLFSLKKEVIIESLQKAAAIIPSRSGAAYLRSLWFHATEGRITVMSTDANIEFIATYSAEVHEVGTLGVNGRQFVDLLRRLPNGDVKILLDDKTGIALIEQGRRKYKVPSNDASWFTPLTVFPEEGAVAWSGDFMQETIDRVSFCIEDDEAADALSCLYMKKQEDGHIDVCGLNGHQFALANVAHEALAAIIPDDGILLQKKYVQELKKWLGPDDIEVNITEKRLFVRTSDGRESISLPRSNFIYPDYTAFLQRLSGDDCSILNGNRKDMLDALDRISLFDTASTNFDLSPTELMLSAQGQETGSANEYLESTYNGTLTRVVFPTRNLMELMTHFTSGALKMTLTEAEGPCGITGNEDPDYRVLIMPMKVAEETYYTE